MNMEISNAIEGAISNISDPSLVERLVEAKKVYFELTGMVNDDDVDYEARMNGFTEWFLFSYIPKHKSVPYIVEYLNKMPISHDLKNSLLNIRYSIFEFVKKTITGKILIKDMLYDRKIKLAKEYFDVGIVPGEIFVARVGEYENESYLLRGIRHLPQEVRSILKRQAKVVRNLGNPSEELKFVLNVEKCKTKWDRYGHVEPTKIFAFQ